MEHFGNLLSFYRPGFDPKQNPREMKEFCLKLIVLFAGIVAWSIFLLYPVI